MAPTGVDPAQHIGALARTEPERLLSAPDGTPWAAVWSHRPVQADVSGLAQHALVLHLSGSTLVEKWCEGRLLGHHSRIGSVSLVPARVRSSWVLGGHSRVLHLYLDPAQLARVAAARDGAPGAPGLRDFFAQDDARCARLLCRMLARAQAGLHDRLAHDELLAELVPHLLLRHAADRPLAPASQRLALTGATLRRLFAHVEEHLAGDLRLAELAAVACLSEDHFLRAFKAAVGCTPHRYVLDRRIARAASSCSSAAVRPSPKSLAPRASGARCRCRRSRS